MLDFENEEPLTVTEAAKAVPGRAVNCATTWRWMRRCSRHQVGSRTNQQPLVTTREALDRFLVALASQAGQKVTPNESSSRKARIAKATRKLAARGI